MNNLELALKAAGVPDEALELRAFMTDLGYHHSSRPLCLALSYFSV